MSIFKKSNKKFIMSAFIINQKTKKQAEIEVLTVSDKVIVIKPKSRLKLSQGEQVWFMTLKGMFSCRIERHKKSSPFKFWTSDYCISLDDKVNPDISSAIPAHVL